MTVALFISIFTIGAIVTGLLTEAIKKYCQNANKKYSANSVALINAVIVGVFGTMVIYTLLVIPWTFNNIVCIPLMALCIWITAMVGYDKVLQTLQQIKDILK